jgi:hypothetical protein
MVGFQPSGSSDDTGRVAGGVSVNKIDQCWSNMTSDMRRSLRPVIGIGINPSPRTEKHIGIP